MFRFQGEHWVSKQVDQRSTKWKTSSSEVGRFESKDDFLSFKNLKRPTREHVVRRPHPDNDPHARTADSMIWEESLFEYPNAGVKSTRLHEKYGKLKPKDNIYTPPKRYKINPSVKLKPLKHNKKKVPSLKLDTQSLRSESPPMSDTSRSQEGSLPPLRSNRSDCSATAWNFAYKDPWQNFGQDGALTKRNPNFSYPGRKFRQHDRFLKSYEYR